MHISEAPRPEGVNINNQAENIYLELMKQAQKFTATNSEGDPATLSLSDLSVASMRLGKSLREFVRSEKFIQLPPDKQQQRIQALKTQLDLLYGTPGLLIVDYMHRLDELTNGLTPESLEF